MQKNKNEWAIGYSCTSACQNGMHVLQVPWHGHTPPRMINRNEQTMMTTADAVSIRLPRKRSTVQMDGLKMPCTRAGAVGRGGR